MKRRELILLLGGATAPWPFALGAQQNAMPVIGFLFANSPGSIAPHLAAYQQGLSETGCVEGQNLAIEYRWAEGSYDRLPTLAAELVEAKTRDLVTAIRIFGGKDAIRSIETLEGDGDRTNMTILAETR